MLKKDFENHTKFDIPRFLQLIQLNILNTNQVFLSWCLLLSMRRAKSIKHTLINSYIKTSDMNIDIFPNIGTNRFNVRCCF